MNDIVANFRKAPRAATRPSLPAITPERSTLINAARVVCVVFMIYVHVNPGVAEFDPATHGVRPFDASRFMMTNTLGRASSALLSVVSGYLAIYSLLRLGSAEVVRRRVRSLVIPMVLWGAAFAALVLAGDLVRPGYFEQVFGGISGWLGGVNAFAGVTKPTANISLAFLRDIFVCTLFLGALRWAHEAGFAVFAALVLLVFAIGSPLLLSPYIFLFYSIGVSLALRGTWPRFSPLVEVASWGLVVALGATITAVEFALALGSRAPWADERMLDALFLAIRFPASVAIFCTLGRLCAWSGFRRGMGALEPYIFTIYCSHLVTLGLVWAVWQAIFGGYYSSAYPVFFWLGAPLAVLGGVVFAATASRLVPGLFQILNGNRAIARPAKATPDLASGA